jgi:hypothetical protein
LAPADERKEEAMSQREKPSGRDLLQIAKRAHLPIRYNGGHIIVTLPKGVGICVLSNPKRNLPERHLDTQRKKFAEAGLL